MDYNNKVNTALAAGEAFDVAFTANWAADYRANSFSGYFTPLDDYLKDTLLLRKNLQTNISLILTI